MASALGCSAPGERGADADTAAGGSASVSDGGAPGASGGATGGAGGLTGFDPAGADSGGSDIPGCVAMASGEARLEPVTLAVAFDVSGSMGKLDLPHHDPALKWDPVVAATKAFFADPQSSGISASLTFFPIDSGDDDKCEAGTYTTPDVGVTPLPSEEFAAAIDDVTPRSEDDWRGGTPTLAVLQGTLDFIQPLAAEDEARKFAVLLVTDGYPQGCGDEDNDIERVAEAAAAVSRDVPVYVIGVSNPPGGPDTVSNLDRIAEAGGTERAFLIETGDPGKTKDEFGAAVRTIRNAAISCEFAIPPPPATQVFDPHKANVVYTSGSTSHSLPYDESCSEPSAWRYDDAAAPTRMVLCEETCATVQADTGALLRVEFGCDRNDVIR